MPALAPQVKPQAAPPVPPSMSPSPEQLSQQLQEALAKIRELEKTQNPALGSAGSVPEPLKPNSNQLAPEHDGSKNGVPTQKPRDDQTEDGPMVTPTGKKVPHQFICNIFLLWPSVSLWFPISNLQSVVQSALVYIVQLNGQGVLILYFH